MADPSYESTSWMQQLPRAASLDLDGTGQAAEHGAAENNLPEGLELGTKPAKRMRNLIAQAMLVEYVRLRPLAERFKQLDDTLRNELDRGTAVEMGPYVAYLDTEEKPRLLQKYIFEKLGLTPSQIEELRADAPLVRHRYLMVERRQG